MRNSQYLLALLCTTLVGLPPELYAQAKQEINPQSTSPWHSSLSRRFLAPEEAPINLSNSGRIEALLRAGRLYLSLQDAVALALENNLDIELQRYGPRIAEADLLRSQAGGTVRGVPTSVADGPSSATNLQTGGSGGGLQSPGGTGTQNGGATVTFSGTQIPNLDESINVNYSRGHRSSPQANSFQTGVPSLVFGNNQLTASVQKEFLLGTSVSFGYSQVTQSSNNLRAEINPVTSGFVNLQVSQPILRGFGRAVNSRNIVIAQNNVKVSDLVFKQQVIATVANIANLYSDLVSFGEDVKVRRQALSTAQKLFEDNRKQVEIGTLAPIEIVRAEAEVARSQQDLTLSETQLLQQETIMKNYLSRTGVMSPSLSEVRVIPTERLTIPDVEPIQPMQDLVATAIENRPELAQTQLQLENSRISLKGSKSQLLPQLDIVANAQNNGLAGSANTLPLPPTAESPFRPANPAFIGSLGSVWTQLLSRNYPDYSLGFQLNVPLRNRAAQADIIRDQLSIRQSEIRQRQELNQIRVDVQNGVIGLQQSRARFLSAQKARILQEQTLDAEQKKYALGASTIFFVIQAQRDLSLAQGTEVSALSAYARAKVAIERATGQILDTFKINLTEAMAGRISVAPSALPADDSQRP